LVELLTWLEASALGQAVRGAGVWSYAVINLVHIVGVATLFGSVLLLDLRLLGVFQRVPLSALSVPTVRLAAAGFVIAAASGVCLLATNATEYKGNPFLLVKFSAIFVGLANVAVIHSMPAWRRRDAGSLLRTERRQLALGGGISLAAWTTALTAGRMLGYW
jgi:hypothetical protein